MSDLKSWSELNRFIAKKTNPRSACATYEQIEAQDKKNKLRYGWKDNGTALDKYDGLHAKYRGDNI